VKQYRRVWVNWVRSNVGVIAISFRLYTNCLHMKVDRSECLANICLHSTEIKGKGRIWSQYALWYIRHSAYYVHLWLILYRACGCILYIKMQYDRYIFQNIIKAWEVHNLTLETSRCSQSSSSLDFNRSDSCESAARIPTELLSNCWQKWYTESLINRTKQAKLSASAFVWNKEET